MNRRNERLLFDVSSNLVLSPLTYIWFIFPVFRKEFIPFSEHISTSLVLNESYLVVSFFLLNLLNFIFNKCVPIHLPELIAGIESLCDEFIKYTWIMLFNVYKSA